MKLLTALAILFLSSTVSANPLLLQAAIEGKHRTPAYVERDVYRNPLKTLQLFDIQPYHSVVEIWPGGGWYTEILAPYLKKKGQLIAAHYDINDTQAEYRSRSRKSFDEKMRNNRKVYGKVKTVSLIFDEASGALKQGAVESNSVDRVVTFRNAHGWYARGIFDAAMAHYFDILKPGGKLGVVQHRAADQQNWMKKNIGYVSREYLILSAIKAGFKLEAEGYFNRNPLDTKHYENGVWQLPPSLRGSKADKDKAQYLAIGESDRMTLVFVKP